ncbi:hypothetical protein IJM16_00250 [Candidatus Saccharibacteria bacterium]|nr:hypothetical protein [Candidatus Saccharibacteria bacterium]
MSTSEKARHEEELHFDSGYKNELELLGANVLLRENRRNRLSYLKNLAKRQLVNAREFRWRDRVTSLQSRSDYYETRAKILIAKRDIAHLDDAIECGVEAIGDHYVDPEDTNNYREVGGSVTVEVRPPDDFGDCVDEPVTDENDATPEAEVDTPIEGEESADDETPAEGDAPTGAEAPADKPPAGMMPR